MERSSGSRGRPSCSREPDRTNHSFDGACPYALSREGREFVRSPHWVAARSLTGPNIPYHFTAHSRCSGRHMTELANINGDGREGCFGTLTGHMTELAKSRGKVGRSPTIGRTSSRNAVVERLPPRLDQRAGLRRLTRHGRLHGDPARPSHKISSYVGLDGDAPCATSSSSVHGAETHVGTPGGLATQGEGRPQRSLSSA